MFFDPSIFLIIIFVKGHLKDHSNEVWLKLAWWYRRDCHLKQIVDDTGQTYTNPNISLRAWISKMYPTQDQHPIECHIKIMGMSAILGMRQGPFIQTVSSYKFIRTKTQV